MRRLTIVVLCLLCLPALASAVRMSAPTVQMGVGTVRQSPGAQPRVIAPSTMPLFHDRRCAPVRCSTYAPVWRYSWYDDGDQGYRDHQAHAEDLEDLARRYDPQLLGEEAEIRPIERRGPLGIARDAIARRDSATAHAALADAFLGNGNHAQAWLLAGFAFAIEDGFDAAGRCFALAYERDPALKARRLNGAAICGSADRLRTLAQRAARHAHKKPSRDAWFAVGVLVHAQGKEIKANELIERAMALPAATP